MQSTGVLSDDRPFPPGAGPIIEPSPTPEEEHIIRNATAIFTRQLQTAWTRQKAPYGFDGALDKARSAGRDTTEHIFAGAGDRAWLAYYLTVGRPGSHFPGKPSEDRVVSAFQRLPSEHRRQVAASVANCEPHHTVTSAIEKLQQPRHRRKRLCVRHTASPPNTPPLALPPPTMGSTPPERALPSDSAADRRETNRTFPSNETANLHMRISNSEHQTASGPHTRHLADVFPAFMCSAIRKNGGVAAVEMVFPYLDDDGAVDCAMSLSILPNKVEYLALELLGWHFETDERGTFRYIVSSNGGSTAMPLETVVLQGAQDEAISKHLGNKVRDAVAASLMYKEEVRQAVRYSKCVSMQINRNPSHDAVLTLNLEFQEGLMLNKILNGRK
ncbi:hypothetical protein CEP51_014221 [Fusarium floridanum]|uniref:Uncharacterized protein n=1 Tax=Fusarium floridanum TaxID=1325733 RepID=A0A428PWZ9_9HYPO|nr:hypothetical protein CEP51_014221 [Fusarium floridanum]